MSSNRRKQKKQINIRHTVRQTCSFWYRYASAASRISRVIGLALLIVLSRDSLRFNPVDYLIIFMIVTFRFVRALIPIPLTLCWQTGREVWNISYSLKDKHCSWFTCWEAKYPESCPFLSPNLRIMVWSPNQRLKKTFFTYARLLLKIWFSLWQFL